VGLPSMGVRVSNGKLNFVEEDMLDECGETQHKRQGGGSWRIKSTRERTAGKGSVDD
jgi:hypothetical protein